MIRRGLRMVDPAEFLSIIKQDCVVFDFGISILMHGSLKQEVKLNDKFIKGDAPYKDCPKYGAETPLTSKECLLCSYIWEGQLEADKIQTVDLHMTEINILKRSSFLWCNLRRDDQ